MVVFVQRSVANYRKAFFISLSKQLGQRLRVLSSNHSNVEGLIEADVEGENFERFPIKTLYFGPFIFQSIKQIKTRISDATAVVLEDNSRILTNLLVARYCNSKHIKVFLWGHGESARHRNNCNKAHLSWLIRKILLSKSSKYFAYNTVSEDSLVSKYDYSREKIITFNNTIEVCNDEIRNQSRLGKSICPTKIKVCFLGRAVKDKGIFDFLKLAKYSKRHNLNIDFTIIGKCSNEKILSQIKAHDNVKYLGHFANLNHVHNMLLDQDVVVSLGFCGLNVNQALNAGCPIITTPDGQNGIYHSPEFYYLEKDKTCIISQNNPEDVINAVLKIKAKQLWFANNCFKAAEKFPFENMVATVGKALVDNVT